MSETILTSSELRKLSDKDLALELTKAKHNLAVLKISIKTGKEKAVHQAKQLKSYIARVLTVQTELKKESTTETNPQTEK